MRTLTPEAAGISIVLIDDTAGYLESAKALIESLMPQFTVLTASNPIEAIALRNNLEGPAIFMSDYDMPDMDGIRLLKYIISSSRFPVFCYLVTAHDDHDIYGECLENGILYFSKKPPPNGKNFNLGKLYTQHIIYAVGKLTENNHKDGLTKLDNSAYFREIWKHDFARARRDKTWSSLLFADMDNLHFINKQHGQTVGDEGLKKVAQALIESGRQKGSDCKFRNSEKADEMGIWMPNTNKIESKVVFERVRENLKNIWVEGPKGLVEIHTSIGMATLSYKQLGSDPDAAYKKIFDLADSDMKKRKIAGKVARGENYPR